MGAAGRIAHSSVTDLRMDEAIASAAAGDPTYPDGSVFVPIGTANLGLVLRSQLDEGRPVVLVLEDGRSALIQPPQPTGSA